MLPNDRVRFLVAAVLSPLVPPVLLAAAILAGSGWSTPASALLLVIGVGAPFSYAGFFLFGLPLFLYLRRHGALRSMPFVVSGIVGGVIVLTAFNLLLTFLVGSSYAFPFEPVQFAWGAFMGLAGSVAFCLVAGITRRSGVRP